METSLSIFAKAGVPTYQSIGFRGRTGRFGLNVIRIAGIATIIAIVAVLTGTRVSDFTKDDMKNHNMIAETRTVGGLHIALPNNLRDFPIGQLLPLP